METNESDTGAIESSDNWKLFNLSLPGSSHLESGRQCDDFSIVKETADGFIVCACDGAGSYKDTHLGAQAIGKAFVETVLETNYLKAKLPRLLFAEVWKKAAKVLGVRQRAKELSATVNAFCLIDQKFYALQIGDGCVFGGANGNDAQLLEKHKGEYANQTVFLNSRTGVMSGNFKVFPPETFDRFVIITDGLENVFIQNREVFKPSFKIFFNLFNDLPSDVFKTKLTDFLYSDRVQKVTDDDMTIILGQKL